ncbi:MAG: hypothetical protein EOP06_19560, partial [Proteobacteria bacterium]
MKIIRGALTQKSKAVIMAADALVLIGITAVVYFWRLGRLGPEFFEARGLWGILALTLAGLYIFGCYDLDGDYRRIRILVRQGIAILISFLTVIVIHYLLSKDRTGLFGRGVLLGSLVCFYAVSAFYRSALHGMYEKARQNADWLFIVNDAIDKILLSDLQKNSFRGKVTMLTKADWPKLE